MLLDAPLTTDRLSLRTLKAEDVTDQYVSWLNDPDINRYLEIRFEKQDLAGTRAYVNGINASADSLMLGMMTRADSRHIGNIKLGPLNKAHLRADIGLLIGDKNCWGQGYASEAIAGMSAYAFDVLKLHKLTAGCYADNEGSVGAFLKCGFEIEARLPAHWASEGTWQGHVALGKVNPAAPPPVGQSA